MLPSHQDALYKASLPPRSRHSSGPTPSIWAPQPHPSSIWSKPLNAYPENNLVPRSHVSIPSMSAHPPPVGKEDVFGPVGYIGENQSTDIGAIGDGRKKINVEFDDNHVEQLLRTLNLNSPAPSAPPPPFHLPALPGSPDFSPVSTTSALLTPTDLSPQKPYDMKLKSPYDFAPAFSNQNSLLFEPTSPNKVHDIQNSSHMASFRPYPPQSSYIPPSPSRFTLFEPFSDVAPAHSIPSFNLSSSQPSAPRRFDSFRGPWRQQRISTSADWLRSDDKPFDLGSSRGGSLDDRSKGSPPYANEQASIFLQQKLKVADTEERAKIVDAICTNGFEMMAHRFGNWAVQRCLEAASTPDERRKIVNCMRGRVVELATNCYGCHVLQKALDCEEDIRLMIVSELLLGDPAQTLVNKHASHVWSKVMELTWTEPAPPIFSYVNKSLKGKWAALACHETGSLVVQHAFENLEESAKDGIVDELINQGFATFSEVAKSQWGSYCIQHILEHGSERHKAMTVDHLVEGLLEFSTHEQGSKSVTKALKEGGKDTLNKTVKRMCEPAKGGRRAIIVDLALTVTGSQLIASTLPTADKDQRALLYECIRSHIVTLRGCKTGSKVIWLFDRMRAYYGY